MDELLQKVTFIDDEHLEGEMTDDEFEAKAGSEFGALRAKAEKDGHDKSFYGRCGEVNVYEKRLKWHGVAFILFVTRHYAMELNGSLPEGFRIDWSYKTNNQNGKTARVIPVPSLRRFYQMMARIPHAYGGDSQWLDLDAGHAGMETWTVRKQVEWILAAAERDIDKVPEVIEKARVMFSKDMQELEKMAEAIQK